MAITLRRYKMLADYEKVNDFLRHNTVRFGLNGNITQPYWEYAHHHPNFDRYRTHRFGIWEENDEIVGVANYEMHLGEACLSAKLGYEWLKLEMIDYAQAELCKIKDGNRSLSFIWVDDHETELIQALASQGYEKTGGHANNIFTYDKPFVERALPEGFSIITTEDEADLWKIKRLMWRGFDHGEEPEDHDTDGNLLAGSAPNFRDDLTIIIKAPNGDYACFAGMWLDGVNDFAYLEPLATDPLYRRLGLATIALTESMKRTKALGATYCFGGSREFYFSVGFETKSFVETWSKTW